MPGLYDARMAADTEPAQGVEASSLKQPARMIARLAEWVAEENIDDLRGAFRRVGLIVEPRDPDYHYVPKYFGHNARKLRTGLNDEAFMELAREVLEARRTFLYYNRLYTLYQAVQNLGLRFPEGPVRIVEAGVFRGGSAYFLGRVAQRVLGKRAEIVAVDTFTGHSRQDVSGQHEGAHSAGTFAGIDLDDVREYLAPVPSVQVVQGRIQEVTPAIEGDIHLIHSDMDLRAPTRFLLDFATQRLAPGGVVVVDDYGFVTSPGVKQAVDEFREAEAQRFVVHGLDSGQALVVRTG
jgi:O-methyltransferase